MQYIAHRINTREELKNIPTEYGVEIDLRDKDNRLILQHDPFSDGENFDSWIKDYRHGTLILNVKNERIENRIQETLQRHAITDYFFLDCSVPMIYKLSECGETKIATRYSEIEPIESVIALKNRISWAWIDCFTQLPPLTKAFHIFQKFGIKTCLVSPELQGRPQDIPVYKRFIEENHIPVTAICTKLINIEKWR
jgi:hypothetical protein